jgi:hypothetical protein
MQEAERRGLISRRQAPPVPERGVQQAERAHHVGLRKRHGPGDGAVHVAFGREIDDGARAVAWPAAGHQRGVADVAMNKVVVRVVGDGSQVAGMPA